MAWIEERRGSWRTVWDPPAASGLSRQSLTWPDEDYAEFARAKISKVKNNISMEDAYTLVTGKDYPKVQQPSDGPTLREWADECLPLRDITTGTYNTYRRQLDEVILPFLGDKPIAKIDYMDVKRFLAYLKNDRGLKSTTQTRYYSLLHMLLNDAVKSLEVPITVNPAVYVNFKRDKVDKDDIGDDSEAEQFLEGWEYLLLLDHAKPDVRSLLQFQAGTGARIGETTALQVQDFDPATQEIQIRRAWKNDMKSGRAELGPTKGGNRRTLVLNDDLAERLAALCKGKDPNEWIFRTPRGRAWSYSNFSHRRWRPTIAAASRCTTHDDGSCECPGVLHRHLKIHWLRHSYATWMLASGERSPAQLAGDLGHETVQMIYKTYGHVLRRNDRSRAKTIDTIMRTFRRWGEEGGPAAMEA